jgi:hypothetical protein
MDKRTPKMTDEHTDAIEFILIKEMQSKSHNIGIKNLRQVWWLIPVIPATREAEIRRIRVQSEPRINSYQDPISKKKNNTK